MAEPKIEFEDQNLKVNIKDVVPLDLAPTVEAATPIIEKENDKIIATTNQEGGRVAAATKRAEIDVADLEPNLKPENVKHGVDIFGTEGTYEPDMESGSATITENGTTTYTTEKDGFKDFTVTVDVEAKLQQKTVTENGTVTPDEGYDGLESVEVDVEPKLQSRTVNVYGNGQFRVTPDEDVDGMDEVIVNADVQPDLQAKTVNVYGNGKIEVTADENKDGLSSVEVNVNVEPNVQSKHITENGIYGPDEGFDALSTVDVDVNPELQEKEVVLTENGTVEVEADEGVYGLKKVIVKGEMEPKLERRRIDVTDNGERFVYPTAGKEGISELHIVTDVQPNLQSKEVILEESGWHEITADEGYGGLDKVDVYANVGGKIQPTVERHITENGVYITAPDEGYDGIEAVIDVVEVVPNIQVKHVEVTENGKKYILPDDGYDYIDYVELDTNVEPKLQRKFIDVEKNGLTQVTPDEGYDGLGQVYVTTHVLPEGQEFHHVITENDTGITVVAPPEAAYTRIFVRAEIPTEEKIVEITRNGTQTITPEEGKLIESVTVDVNVGAQTKIVPKLENDGWNTILPDEGYDAMKEVRVYSSGDKLLSAIWNGADSSANPIDIYSTSIRKIPKSALSMNKNVRNIELPNCTTIADSAFSNATGLKDVKIGEGLLTGGADISGFLNSSVENVSGKISKANGFNSCKKLKSFSSSANTVNLVSYAFNKSTIETFVGNATTVSSYTFEGCTNLKSFSAYSGSLNSSIGSNSFANCSSLEELKNVYLTSVSDKAFYLCSQLKEINLRPLYVIPISTSSFDGCHSLHTVNGNVGRIYNAGFNDCISLKNIDLSKVTSIGDSGFSNCFSMNSTIYLPLCITIGNYAFRTNTDNPWMEEIHFGYEVPSNSGTFGSNAFQNQTNLKKIVIHTGTFVWQIQTDTFADSAVESGECQIYVPDDMVSKYKANANWSKYRLQIHGISEATRESIKGQVITIDNKQYRVIEDYIDDVRYNAKLLYLGNDVNTKYGGTTGPYGRMYNGSTLDTYLNTTFYNTLSDSLKAAIIPQQRMQYFYSSSTDSSKFDITSAYDFQCYDKTDNVWIKYTQAGFSNVGERNVFALEAYEVVNYLTKQTMQNGDISRMFFNSYPSYVATPVWLASANKDYDTFALAASATHDAIGNALNINFSQCAKPAFVVDLERVAWIDEKGEKHNWQDTESGTDIPEAPINPDPSDPDVDPSGPDITPDEPEIAPPDPDVAPDPDMPTDMPEAPIPPEPDEPEMAPDEPEMAP